MRKLMVVLTVLFLFSCKKSNDGPPPFLPAGYWEGTLSQGVPAVFLNRADGTGIFYFSNGYYDTAHASNKIRYTYTTTANSWYAKGADTSGATAIIQTSEAVPGFMKGVVLLHLTAGGNEYALPFEVFKQ